MAEPFAFTHHLHAIVTPSLSPLGLKRKGSKYTRVSDGAIQEIWFQRDFYNSVYQSQMRPCRFFLNLNCGHTDQEYSATGLRLINPAARRDPLWWFVLTKKQRDEQWPLLNEAQKNDLLEVQNSRDWWYSTEEELCHQFRLASGEILSKGLPYLERVASSLDDADFKAHLDTATELATSWYKVPDESASAFLPPNQHSINKGESVPWYRRIFGK